MTTPKVATYVRGALCALVVVPMVFLAVYPVLTVMLPEQVAILVDLPQDLTVVLLLDAVIVPVAAAVFYLRARRRAAAWRVGTARDDLDTRDAY